jgi:hypothetical protein
MIMTDSEQNVTPISRRSFVSLALIALLPRRTNELPQPKFGIGDLVYSQFEGDCSTYRFWGKVHGLVYSPNDTYHQGWVYSCQWVKAIPPDPTAHLLAEVDEIDLLPWRNHAGLP